MLEERLAKYINNEKGGLFLNYDPTTIARILRAAGNPHKSFPCVHIAGTNGKGTTSWLIAGMLEEAGYKTGLYTSPHLVNINERIRINRTPADDAALIAILDTIESTLHEEGEPFPTYFDILTAVAFIYFREQGIDAAVIETGLGGRLDSTNVIDSVISIITDISYDHTAILGSTIEQIALEKAGIIKYGQTVITSNSTGIGLDVIKNASSQKGSTLLASGEDFIVTVLESGRDGFYFSYSSGDKSPATLYTPLLPVHQAGNCGLAITAALVLAKSHFPLITDDIIKSTLSKTAVPGRFERLCSNPEIIFDPAHNVAALTGLVSHLEKHHNPEKTVMIISLMKDKATPELISLLKSLKFPVIYLVLDDPRAFVPAEGLFHTITSNPDVIIKRILSDNMENTYIFTGTFRNYLCAVRIALAAGRSMQDSL